MISLSYQHLKRRDGILSRKTSKESKEAKDKDNKSDSGTTKKRSGKIESTSAPNSARDLTSITPKKEEPGGAKKTFQEKMTHLQSGQANEKIRTQSARTTNVCDGSMMANLKLK